MLSHHINKCKCTGNVVVIVFPGLCNGLTNSLKSCKVDHGAYIFLGKNIIKCLSVPDISLVENRCLTGYCLDPSEHLLTCIGKIIKNDNLPACILKLHNSVASDKSGTAGNKYLAHMSSYNPYFDPMGSAAAGDDQSSGYAKCRRRHFKGSAGYFHLQKQS